MFYAIDVKETYNTMALLLEVIKYKDYEKNATASLKVVAPLFIVDSHDTKNHCTIMEWPVRKLYVALLEWKM